MIIFTQLRSHFGTEIATHSPVPSGAGSRSSMFSVEGNMFV